MKHPTHYSSSLSEQDSEPTLMDATDLGQSQYADGDPFLLFLEERRYATSSRYFNRKTLSIYGIAAVLLVISVILANWAVSKWGLTFLLDLSMYSLLFVIGLANWLDHHDHPIAAGILVTIAMALMPVAIYSLENVLGFWSNSVLIMHWMEYSFDARTLVMAAGSLLLGLIMLWRFGYSYLVLPVMIATLALALDVIPVLQLKSQLGIFTDEGWIFRKQIVLGFGIVSLVLGLVIDLFRKSDKDYAFWMYLFGALCIWSGISTLGNSGVSESLLYLGVNVFCILLGTLFKARIFTLFGGIGLAMVAGDLSWYAFRLSFNFVLILSLMVALLLAAALWWRNHESKLRRQFKLQLPLARQNKLEQH